jgi:hypothetical protein
MKKQNHRIPIVGFVFFLILFSPCLLRAQDKRSLPLDLYLIVDGSSMLKDGKNEAIAWISSQVIDLILQEGDTLTLWSAGDKAQLIFSETVGAQRNSVKDRLKNLDTSGKGADFTGALRDAVSRVNSAAKAGRLSVTMVVSGSAEALAPSLDGGSGGLFRWSRVDEYAHWQVLVVAPGIGERVSRAAAAYMGGR